MSRSERLNELRARFPLPSGWSPLQVVDERVVAGDLCFHGVGVASTAPDGEEVTGSAAELDGDAGGRAYFELLERVAVKEAMAAGPGRCDLRAITGEVVATSDRAEVFPVDRDRDRTRLARSNGVALREDWRSAAQRAYWELAERDRVLRSWLGEVAPSSVPHIVRATALSQLGDYEWGSYLFAAGRSSFADDVVVAGVFGFPVFRGRPLVIGFGAGPSVDAAGAAALREAGQQVAFLWAEAPPSSRPATGPTPTHHLDHYQFPEHHAVIRNWLAGDHAKYFRESELPAPGRGPAKVAFFDATPGWLRGLTVVRALCSGALPLSFGEWELARNLPPDLRVHPIA